MLVSVTELWNAETHGFPYKESLAELATICDVCFVVLCGEQTDGTEEALLGLDKVRTIGAPSVENHEQIADRVNIGILAAKTYGNDTVVLHVQGDEFIECNDALADAISLNRHKLLGDEAITLAFPRWDFTEEASHVTPIFESEPPVSRCFAVKWFPEIRSRGDGMHIDGGTGRQLAEDCPIWHYHGCQSEAQWQRKEHDFQVLYTRGENPAFGEPDKRIMQGAEIAWTDPRSRRYPVPRPHPARMQEWLKKSWMTSDAESNP